MAHLQEERDVKDATRDKYRAINKARNLRHDEVMDHLESHMLGCTDPDCDICDMGESGSMIDDDDEGEGPVHDVGDRSSEGREGAGYDIDTEGEKAVKEARGDKHNLMEHGEHISKHPGFKAVQSQIAKKQGLSNKAAGAILASRSRGASKAAKHANPRLARVKG